MNLEILLCSNQIFGTKQKAFIACHLDNGYSGRLVIDYKGLVIGMVLGGRGQNVLTTTIMPSYAIRVAIHGAIIN